MYKETLRSIPNSYEDFVNSVNGWMEENETIKNKVLNQLNSNPKSTPSDVLGVLWECLGIGAPLEIVDDTKDEAYIPVSGGMRVAY